jgi:hypothetical protein
MEGEVLLVGKGSLWPSCLNGDEKVRLWDFTHAVRFWTVASFHSSNRPSSA